MVNLKIQNLNIHYGNFHAIKDFNLSIQHGEVLTILGPSGCGKTTLLRSLAGFVTPSSGKIYFDDDEVTKIAARKRETGMVFQNYALWPHMSVEANVGYGLRLRKVDKKKQKQLVSKHLTLMQIGDQEGKIPRELSGGQQQRVALARAVIIRPKVLLCDEPLSNLDFKLRVELRTEIRKLAKNLRITTVYVTHDQTEALAISDKIAVVKAGEIEQVGTPLEIFNDPRTFFVATFIGENNVLHGKIITKLDTGYEVKVESVGSLKVSLTQKELKINDEIQIVIRYDSLLWNTNGENSVRGTVSNTAFHGNFVQIELQLANKEKFTINIYENLPDALKIKEGSEVSVGIKSKEMLLFQNGKRIDTQL